MYWHLRPGRPSIKTRTKVYRPIGSRLTTRLTHASTTGPSPSSYGYALDGAGNLTSVNAKGTTTNYTYNPANEIATANGHTDTYDADGNQTSNGNGLTAAYNALGQTTSTANNITTPLSYLGEGQNQLAGEGNSALHNDLFGLASHQAGSSTNYFTRDISGQQIDERTTTGTYNYLNPTDQRWTQQDPLNQVTDASQADRYAYAGGNPVNGIDPTGTNLLHDALNIAAVVPYAAYYASYHAAKVLPQNSLLEAGQIGGLAGDAGIDYIKGHTVTTESVRDEGFTGCVLPRNLGCGVRTYLPGIHTNGNMNVTSAGLRRRARTTSVEGNKEVAASPSATDLRRRLAISMGFIALVIICAVSLGLAFGKSGVVPSMAAAVVIGAVMLWTMARFGSRGGQ